MFVHMKRVVIGTAGHVDHGKTSLIKALTGADCDRLKEKRKAGMFGPPPKTEEEKPELNIES